MLSARVARRCTVSWLNPSRSSLIAGEVEGIREDVKREGLAGKAVPFLLIAMALLAGCRPSRSAALPPTTGEMVEIPAGWFTMGSDRGPAASQPSHRVYLSAYRMDRYEATHRRFEQYVQASRQLPLAWQNGVPAAEPAHPVTGILWREAAAFCRWYGGRLPTEAEWEKAARGDDGRLYPWGNWWAPRLANTAANGRGGVLPVGSFPQGQSPYGLLDMVGNVEEWVADYQDPNYYAVSPSWNPQGPSAVLDHGLRGGSWASPQEKANTIYRNSSHSARPNPRVGFRCAADLEP